MAIQRPTAFTKAFAAEMRGFMSSQGLSQVQLAMQIGRSQAYISDRMTGKAAFDMDDVDGIARLMGMTGSELLRRVAQRVAERPGSDRPGSLAGDWALAAYSSDDGVPPNATDHDFDN